MNFITRILILTAILLNSYCTFAQQFLERVYLNDSTTVYEGFVIEQAPSKYVKIYRTKEKDTIEVNLNKVWKLTKVYKIDTLKVLKRNLINKEIKNKYERVAFIELLGAGGLYSLNYDMRTERGKRNGWGFRVGYEYLALNLNDSITSDRIKISFRAFPFQLNYLFGKRKGFLELGVGSTFISPKVSGPGTANIDPELIEGFNQTVRSVVGTFTIGYRHTPYNGGVMYKIAYVPLLVNGNLIPFFGFGLGYHFK